MIRSKTLVALVAVISLSLGAIWPSVGDAAGVPQVSSLGQIQDGLAVPGKMDIDAQGNLYVADARTNSILKYDAAGTLMRTFSAVPVSGVAVAVTADGSRLYAAAEGKVVVLNAETGEFVADLVSLDIVGDIAADAAGNVYVVDAINVSVLKFDATGTQVAAIAGFGVGDGLFRRLSVLGVNDAAGEIYVAGEAEAGTYTGSSVVQIFGLDGQFHGKIATAAEFGGALSICSGIAFDAEGREYYLDQYNANIRVRDRAAGFLQTVSIKGEGAGQMVKPVDVDYDATSSRLLVASDNVKIELYGVDGGVTPAVNQPPTVPVLLSPVAGGEANSTSPQLRFANSTDANGDAISYDVVVSGLPLLSTAQMAGSESYVVAEGLTENALYTWKAMARDARGVESAWSAEQMFFVNAVAEAPTAPALTSGADGAPLTGAGLLAWTASTDPDPNETISYRLEIAEDVTFTDAVVTVEGGALQTRLDALADYTTLVDGLDYVWRVTAVDSTGLEAGSAVGTFRYDTAMLNVTANMPGAQVSLGGNAAYAGNRVGEAPVEFRDLPAGAYTVVVERAGCEQSVTQIEITAAGNADVYAELALAVAPELKNGAALRAGKAKLKVGMGASPFPVDFNNDGMVDFLVGDESGALSLFEAVSERGSKVQYADAKTLNIAPVVGATPFVVDWNNDNRKDLLVGGVDGTVTLFLQKSFSYDGAPNFAAGKLLMTDDLKPLDVGAAVTPAVVDFDQDGDKDLVVGTADGMLAVYLNVGTDAQPTLSADAVALGSFSGPVAAQFIDWNADGQRDLLVTNAGALARYAQNADGTFSAAETLLSDRSTLADPGVRFAVIDLDGEQGKDVCAGFSDGQVVLYRSAGSEYLPSVTTALLDKVAQVKDSADADAAALLDAAAADINAGNLKAAADKVKTLEGDAAAELVSLLSR